MVGQGTTAIFITFLFAMVGYAGLTATVLLSLRRELPVRFWRAVAVVILVHVAMVWVYRYKGDVSLAVRNGYAGFVMFHVAVSLVLASLVVGRRLARLLVRTVFFIVTMGALGAVFLYDVVAIYRIPVMLCAAAGLAGLAWTLIRRRPAAAATVLALLLVAGEARAQNIPAIDSLLQAEVDDGHIAGAAVQVVRDGRTIHRAAYGFAQLYEFGRVRLESPDTMTTHHLFDLASLTKVFATTFGVMVLVDRGRIDLDAPVRCYLPEFSGPRKDSVTVRHLLTHTAGLSEWEPTYYHAATPQEVLAFIAGLPLKYRVGAERHYSDLGFMLLGFLIERVSEQRLDAFVARHVYEPLGLTNTLFVPLKRGVPPSQIAATSHGNPFERRMVYDDAFGYECDEDPESWDGWRSYTLRGEVNDGNAFYANGGTAGHAGLFSTLDDLQRLVDVMLDGGKPLLSREVVRMFTTKDAFGNGLGWAMDPAVIQAAKAPEGTFGHTGFTGTNVVVIPGYDLSIILLTNRQNVDVGASGSYYNLNPTRRRLTSIILDYVRR